MTPTVSLQITAIPVTAMRCMLAGDLMKNFGFSDEDIAAGQQGYSEGLFESFVVIGLDANGYPQEEVVLRFEDLTDDRKITLDEANGRSVFELVNPRMAGALRYSLDTFQRKGLHPKVFFQWSARAKANPDLIADALVRLGLVLVSLPSYEPGYAARPYFSISPGADTGTHFELYHARRIK